MAGEKLEPLLPFDGREPFGSADDFFETLGGIPPAPEHADEDSWADEQEVRIVTTKDPELDALAQAIVDGEVGLDQLSHQQVLELSKRPDFMIVKESLIVGEN